MIKKFFCIVLSAVIMAGAAVPGPVAALGDQSGAAVGSAMTEAGKSGAAGSSAQTDIVNSGAVGEQTATGGAAMTDTVNSGAAGDPSVNEDEKNTGDKTEGTEAGNIDEMKAGSETDEKNTVGETDKTETGETDDNNTAGESGDAEQPSGSSPALKSAPNPDTESSAVYTRGEDLAKLTSASVSLGADLTLTVGATVDASVAAPSMRFCMEGFPEYVAQGRASSESGAWLFEFPGIGAQCMADVITMDVLDGYTIIGTSAYSIREYFCGICSLSAEQLGLSEQKYARLKTLMADTLVYGAAAQVYTGHNVDDPASSPEWVAESKSAVPEAPASEYRTIVPNTGEDRVTGAALILYNDVKFRFKVRAAQADTLIVSGGSHTWTYELTDDLKEGDLYVIRTGGLMASDFDTVFEVSLRKNGETCHAIAYSVNTYVSSKYNSDNTALADLVKAIYNYGLSADIYRMPEETGQPDDPGVTEPEVISVRHLGKVTTDLNLRQTAGVTSSGKLTTIPKDTLLTIEDTTPVTNGDRTVNWYKVTYNGYTGWISGNYVVLLTVEDTEDQEGVSHRTGRVVTSGGVLNVRSDPNTSSSSQVITQLPNGSTVTILGETEGQTVSADYGSKWYKILVNYKTGYVYNRYIVLDELPDTPGDDAFEIYLEEQGFPESYRTRLRALHAAYPQWTFVADHISEDWGVCVEEQYSFGSMLPASWGGTKAVSLVNKDAPASWKSTDPEAYQNGEWVTNWDGNSWAIASRAIIRYYMDPRNFLNSTDVFQFLDMQYNSTQTASAVSTAASTIGAGWLSGVYTHLTDNTTIDYPEVITRVSSAAGINPIAIVCIITQELGTTSVAVNRPQISGSKAGYEGYYNYFNVGAYVDATYTTAWERGLHVARDIYSWNSREAALAGGAQIFANRYLGRNQQTVYYKRFNVVNSTVSDQFSTDIEGACGEGRLLGKAYTEDLRTGGALTFRIPVYDGMPSNPCTIP